jgi:hypothetical protein
VAGQVQGAQRVSGARSLAVVVAVAQADPARLIPPVSPLLTALSPARAPSPRAPVSPVRIAPPPLPGSHPRNPTPKARPRFFPRSPPPAPPAPRLPKPPDPPGASPQEREPDGAPRVVAVGVRQPPLGRPSAYPAIGLTLRRR